MDRTNFNTPQGKSAHIHNFELSLTFLKKYTDDDKYRFER